MIQSVFFQDEKSIGAFSSDTTRRRANYKLATRDEFRTFLIRIVDALDRQGVCIDVRNDPVFYHRFILLTGIGFRLNDGFERFQDFIDPNVLERLRDHRFPGTVAGDENLNCLSSLTKSSR